MFLMLVRIGQCLLFSSALSLHSLAQRSRSIFPARVHGGPDWSCQCMLEESCMLFADHFLLSIYLQGRFRVVSIEEAKYQYSQILSLCRVHALALSTGSHARV